MERKSARIEGGPLKSIKEVGETASSEELATAEELATRSQPNTSWLRTSRWGLCWLATVVCRRGNLDSNSSGNRPSLHQPAPPVAALHPTLQAKEVNSADCSFSSAIPYIIYIYLCKE